MTERPISDATKRMAKTLGAEFMPTKPLSDEGLLALEVMAVHDALGHIPDFQVRVPDLHLSRMNCRAILRDAGRVLSRPSPEPVGYERVAEAARRFVAKLDECLPHIDGCIQISTIHHAPYRGPSFETELAELRTALNAKP